MIVYPLIHALAGCGRRCAVLILGGIGLSSTQHSVGVASLRSEQQYLYGIATVLTVPVMLFETLLTVTCFVSVSPEEYKKWYLVGDRFSNFSVFCHSR